MHKLNLTPAMLRWILGNFLVIVVCFNVGKNHRYIIFRLKFIEAGYKGATAWGQTGEGTCIDIFHTC